jgi:hypothetical protein
MTAMRNLEVTHHVDGNVTVVKELTRDVHESVKVIEEVTRGVDDNVKVTKQGANCALSFMRVMTLFRFGCQNSNGRAKTFVTH